MRKNFSAAFRSLAENWQRGVLSAIGVMVAAIAILLLISIGKGVQKDITAEIEDFGAGILIVLPGRIEFGNFNPNLGGKSYLSAANVEDIQRVEGVVRVAKWSFAGGGLRAGEKEAFPLLVASGPEWFQMHKVNIKAGNIYTSANARDQVIVIGDTAATQLFGAEDPIGKEVQLNKEAYRVIGVTTSKSSGSGLFSMQGLANVAYVPIDALERTTENVQIDRLMVQVSPNVEPKTLVQSVESALGKRLDRQQYSVLTQEDLLGLVFKVMSILTTLVVGLTSIALFVGGVGVMTVMLMSVNERNKEIGIRKATGARKSDIFWQFLIESIAIGLTGVLAGLGISLIVCYFLREFTRIKPLVTVDTVAITLLVGVGIGSIFGLIPAMKAARRDPVDALRNE